MAWQGRANGRLPRRPPRPAWLGLAWGWGAVVSARGWRGAARCGARRGLGGPWGGVAGVVVG